MDHRDPNDLVTVAELLEYRDFVSKQLHRLQRGLVLRYLGLVVAFLCAGGAALWTSHVGGDVRKDEAARLAQQAKTEQKRLTDQIQIERWNAAWTGCAQANQRYLDVKQYVDNKGLKPAAKQLILEVIGKSAPRRLNCTQYAFTVVPNLPKEK